MPNTYNTIFDSIKTICINHGQLKGSFGFGEVADIAVSGDTKYPMMYVTPKPCVVKKGEVGYAFDIRIMDRLKTGYIAKEEMEILNDTMQIALDIIAQLKHGSSNTYPFDIKFDQTLTPFVEWVDDFLAGWLFSVTLFVPFTADECAVPLISSPSSTALLITDDASLLLA